MIEQIYTPDKIITHMWGYEQTNIDFFKIIKRSGDFVTLQPLKSYGNYPTEQRVVKTRKAAYGKCDAMYDNRFWHGRKVKSGYKIEVD